MNDKAASQEGNIVGGHQAGRDVKITQRQDPRTTMRTLTQRFREEKKEDKTFRRVIDSLQYYLESSPPEATRDLEQKLTVAQRENHLSEATALKELFAKKLARNQLSLVAQEIFAWALGHMQVAFQVHVRPLIAVDEAPEVIDRAVLEKVIQPTITELEDNVLILNYQELRGMLYYLTGNCHIEWHIRA